jgi:hypothetical protein
MNPNWTHETDRRVTIKRDDSDLDRYTVTVEGGPTFHGTLLNVAGRASALGDGSLLELGGGDTTIHIEGRDDSRGPDGELLAVGFEAVATI